VGVFQPLHVADISGDGGQSRQTEHVLPGQRAIGFLQCLADGGFQAGIRDGHVLCQGRNREARERQHGQQQRTDDSKNGFHNIDRFGSGASRPRDEHDPEAKDEISDEGADTLGLTTA